MILFIKHANKKACGSSQQQLARTLLMSFGIKFPIKAKKQPGLDFPDNIEGWVVYDLTGWIPGYWTVGTQYADENSFWVNFENDPLFENMVIHSARDMF